MSLELLDPESQQLYTELKATVMEHAEKVAITLDALVRIRDGRLYRAEFKTFSAFCESVGMNTRKAYRLLEDKAKKPKRIAAPKPVIEADQVSQAGPGQVAPEAFESANDKYQIRTKAVVPIIESQTIRNDPEAAAKKVQEMMDKLSLSSVPGIIAEQYRTHSPIPPMDRPEERPQAFEMIPIQTTKEWADSGKSIASTELKAWAVKRRAMNDATSEDDAAWADYIAGQIIL